MMTFEKTMKGNLVYVLQILSVILNMDSDGIGDMS